MPALYTPGGKTGEFTMKGVRGPASYYIAAENPPFPLRQAPNTTTVGPKFTFSTIVETSQQIGTLNITGCVMKKM